MIRAVQIFPTKFLGVLADHGEFPIERIKLDRNSKWLGSASHDEMLKLTDVEDALEESEDEGADGKDSDAGSEAGDQEAGLGDISPKKASKAGNETDDSDDTDSDSNSTTKKRRKKSKDAIGARKKIDTTVDKSFFADL